jgi:hypothetical protein
VAVVMTYTSLVADLQAYLERGYSATDDSTVFAQIPNLITLAERAISRRLKILGFLTSVMTTFPLNQPTYPKPDRWRATVSMRYGAVASDTTFNLGTPIYPRSYEYCRRYWPDQRQVAPPKFYADYDYQNWLFVPTPDQVYPFEVLYYQQPPYLGTDNASNWLTEYAPNCLLYRALLEAEPFLKNDERVATWKQYYEEEINGLDVESMRRAADRAAVRKED